MTSCRLLVNTAVVGVGVVGLAGYGVYKGGEAVVSTVGDAGSAVGDAVGGTHDSVVVSRGTLKMKSKYSVTLLYHAASKACQNAEFNSITGQKDALSGQVHAKTSSNENVLVTLEMLEKGVTAVQIRIGDGNLKQSEYLYDQMLTLLGDES
ncbi:MULTISPECIES: DUF3568 family protein [unclassified Lentimonas]|nr:MULTISPECIES: DUF3568 family protein [unclassified Lentimonas]CAA6693544.1 Unannotated [Lentimonas sp. CC19]CAA7181551.1 Unannotated [Lentimonas sp. CC8]CAA6678590.1 Unannotated [Lentimonas sp. CC4]CAA6685822.1 Unannotated [Lentimonas sp. CC6]CAA6695871.1 Unannotated [Lentimonas sp. CC10]